MILRHFVQELRSQNENEKSNDSLIFNSRVLCKLFSLSLLTKLIFSKTETTKVICRMGNS